MSPSKIVHILILKNFLLEYAYTEYYYLKVNLDQKIPLNVNQCQYYPNDQIYLQHNTAKVDRAHIHLHTALPITFEIIILFIYT